MGDKLKSRKFWICAAAFLASVGTGIAGAFSGNETLASVAAVCTILSAGIYAACEAAVDRASIFSNTTETQVITTESNSTSQTHSVEAKSDDVLTVATVLAPAPVEEQQPVMEDE